MARSQLVEEVKNLHKTLIKEGLGDVFKGSEPLVDGLDSLSSLSYQRKLKLTTHAANLSASLLYLERMLGASSKNTLSESEVQKEINELKLELEEKQQLIQRAEQRIEMWIKELSGDETVVIDL